jgi:uncharacterized protein
MYFALFYDYVPDALERRKPYRPEHLAYAGEAQKAGRLIMAGAFDPPTDGALFLFKADAAQDVEAFAKADPYVRNGVVTAWRVKPWNVVIGGQG